MSHLAVSSTYDLKLSSDISDGIFYSDMYF